MRRVVLAAFILAISAGAAAQYVGYDGYGEYAGYGSITGQGFKGYFTITTEPDSVKGSVDLIDFPMLLTAINFPDEVKDADGLHPAANGGGGLRFFNDSGDSIPAEIVSFVTNNDPSLATAEIWIKVPALSFDTATVITCWFDTGLPAIPVANPTLGGQLVWSDYEAVFHLTDLTDATGNGYTGVATGAVTSTSGLAGGAFDFPLGLTNDIQVASLDVSSIDGQFLIWANSNSVQIDFDPYFMSLLTSTPRFTMTPDGFPNIRSGLTSTSGTVDRENDGLWHCYSYSYQTSGTPNYQGYFDGFQLVNNATDAEVDLTTTDLYIGNWRVSPSGHGWTGLLDEFRFRNSTATQGWVQTECSNARFPGDFAEAGAVN